MVIGLLPSPCSIKKPPLLGFDKGGNMYTHNRLLFMVVLTFCCTNGYSTAQGVKLDASLAKWKHQTLQRSFQRMGWSSLNIDSSVPEVYASPKLSCHEEGYYNHPSDCTKFYRCISDFGNKEYSPLAFSCAPGTVFSQDISSCVSGPCPLEGVSVLGAPEFRVSAAGEPPLRSIESPMCASEGRISDPDDCGVFYECVRGSSGELIANKQSCFGHVFDATLKECVPVGMANGCIADSNSITRSDTADVLQLQNPCADSENQFLCLDCKTVVLCIDRLPQIIPCKYGNTCSNDTTNFRGGVCYPNSPDECTCNSQDIFKPDVYDPSKFLTCSSEGAEPFVQSCPEGLEFNEEYSSCGASTNAACSKSGTFAVQSDCTKYHTCTYTTTGSFFLSVFTCDNNTMYNEEKGTCEDPCDWYNGTFTCDTEGRFPNPGDCTSFFECIKDPDTENFIKIKHVCQEGSEWLPLVDAYHCVRKGSTKEECIPKTPNTCRVPGEWCNINECGSNNGGCEQSCSNTEGSFSCSCGAGYSLGKDSKSCDDINECDSNNGGCEQSCSNTEGSFSCSCGAGYSLGNDSKSCDGCKLPWIGLVGHGCYLFIKERGDWDTARASCKRVGGDLAILSTAAKRQTAANHIESAGDASVYIWWLGATDRSGQWKWLDGTPVNDGWSYNEPSHEHVDPGNTCLHFQRPVQNNADLWDLHCTDTRDGFICEK